MSFVTQLVPQPGRVSVADVTARLSAPSLRLQPFDAEVLDFADALARALFRDREARNRPELQSLAFWMRRAELGRLKEDFCALSTESTVLVPRGLVFHVPPANVDTMFVYSWMLSLLVGNTNIVRLSSRAAEGASIICRILNDVLAAIAPGVASASVVVQYGHDDEITAAISAACDVRVIWGGDESVGNIRRIPLSAHAKELTFPDRYSLAVIRAAAYVDADQPTKLDLARRFYNDTFWFDQVACASPRLVIWVGDDRACDEAARVFHDLLAREVEGKQYTLATAPRLRKLSFAYGAILDRPVSRYQVFGSEAAVLQLDHLRSFDRAHCGGGLLFQAYTQTLDETVPVLARQDQTLTHFGFTPDELHAFARRLNGRAIDRLVPVGQALTFNRFWDGYDLLREFTRSVYVQS